MFCSGKGENCLVAEWRRKPISASPTLMDPFQPSLVMMCCGIDATSHTVEQQRYQPSEMRRVELRDYSLWKVISSDAYKVMKSIVAAHTVW
jgi:hypothetical protein